jgi:6-phosphogluconate dehydrogenase (decarboxylating)
MSKKNVMNSDYLVKNLLDEIAQTPTSAADVATVAPLFSFVAKKTGYVRIDCDYAVSNGGDAQTCTVTVAIGRTAAAVGEVLPYTAQPAVGGSGFGSGHYVIAVEAGLQYDVIGTSTSGLAILSGVVSMQYL